MQMLNYLKLISNYYRGAQKTSIDGFPKMIINKKRTLKVQEIENNKENPSNGVILSAKLSIAT